MVGEGSDVKHYSFLCLINPQEAPVLSQRFGSGRAMEAPMCLLQLQGGQGPGHLLPAPAPAVRLLLPC